MKFEKGKKVKVVGNSVSHEFEIGSVITMNKDISDVSDFSDFESEEFVSGSVWWLPFSDCEEIATKPHRYKSREVNGMDVIDLVKHWNLNFNEGNVLKYLLRDKGQDLEDLEKIIDYAQRELKHLRNL